jgi:hypothetical protein
MGFLDTGTNRTGKSYLYPLPATADPHKYLQDTDWNGAAQDWLDLRSGIIAATTVGFTPQTSRPAAFLNGGGTQRLWVRNSDKHLFYYDGTTDNDITSAGGGITGSISSNQVAYGSGANSIQGSAALTFNGTTVGSNAQLHFSSSVAATTPAYLFEAQSAYVNQVSHQFKAGGVVVLDIQPGSSGTTVLDFYQSSTGGSPGALAGSISANSTGLDLWGGGNAILVDTPDFQPVLDNTTACGGSSNRWSTVYTTVLDAGSGNMTLNALSNISVNAGKNFKALSGAGVFDWQLATGTFDTSTGVNTFHGSSHSFLNSISIAGSASTTFLDMTDGSSAATSAANHGRIRYNDSTHQFEASVNNGAWGSLAGSSGAVTSVTNSDGTLTISPTTGAVVASIALGHANSWTGAQTFAGTAVVAQTASSGAPNPGLTITPGAHTALTAEHNSVLFDGSGTTQQFTAASAPATQRSIYIRPVTYSATSSATITTAATVAISGAPVAGTNMTITNALSLWVAAGITKLDGSLTLTGGATASGSNAFDLSGSTGAFKTSTGAATYGGSANTFNGTNTSGGLVTIAPTAASSGTQGTLVLTGPASTSQTTTVEVNGALLDFSATRTWATGAITTQREVYIKAPTYAFGGSSTITDAATLSISGPPIAGTNATLTRAWAIEWDSGLVGTKGNNSVSFMSGVTDGSSAVGYIFNTVNSFATSGDKLAVFQVAGTDRVQILPSPQGSTPTGFILRQNGASNNGVLTLDETTGAKLQYTTSNYINCASSSVLITNSSTTLQLSSTTTSITAGKFAVTSTATTSGFSVAITGSVNSSGTRGQLSVTTNADTGQTTTVEINSVLFDLSATRTWATGAITNQREFYIKAPTYAFAGASTITTAATVCISGAPAAGTNATLTSSYALWVAGGGVNMGQATVTQLTSISTGVTINAASGVITTVSVSTAARTAESAFTVTNNCCYSGSVVVAEVIGYGGTMFTNGQPDVAVGAPSNGSFTIKVINRDASNALSSGALKIHFHIF